MVCCCGVHGVSVVVYIILLLGLLSKDASVGIAEATATPASTAKGSSLRATKRRTEKASNGSDNADEGFSAFTITTADADGGAEEYANSRPNDTNRDDIGLCLGVAEQSDIEGEEALAGNETVVGNSTSKISCRDYDRDEYTCNNEIKGCFWIRLPKCGDGPCLDLYTDEEDTTCLFVMLLFICIAMSLCCLTGWTTVACCACACVRRRRRERKVQDERKQVHQELAARHNAFRRRIVPNNGENNDSTNNNNTMNDQDASRSNAETVNNDNAPSIFYVHDETLVMGTDLERGDQNSNTSTTDESERPSTALEFVNNNSNSNELSEGDEGNDYEEHEFNSTRRRIGTPESYSAGSSSASIPSSTSPRPSLTTTRRTPTTTPLHIRTHVASVQLF